MRLVVFFPGLGAFANVTGKLLEFFENDPDTDVMCVSYDSFGFRGYKTQAKRLSTPLAHTEAGYDQVFYIGHSMGGHVAAELINNYGHKPTKLVTVGSPQSKFRFLLPINGLFRDFSEEPHWPTDTPTLHLSGGLDPLSRTDHSIGFFTHLSILWSSQAQAMIYSYIRYE